MIQPNELRLLNWVKYDNRYFQIHSIAYVFPTLNTDEFGIGVVDYNNIQPIELTPDILEAAGFGLAEYQNRKGITYEHNKFDIWLYHYEKNNFYSCSCFPDGSKPIKYLHQLQNLYWCLCGEELQIDINKINNNYERH